MNFFNCDKCGTLVGYAHTAKGIRYLANWSHEYENGARYRRGAHYKTCADAEAARDERRAAQAKWEAEQAAAREAARPLRILHRWTFVYGDEFRAWSAKDPEAAGAHFEAHCKRLGL